jgi:ATP-binding cassette subfamily C (CFTR/MRP) protein 1
MDRKLIHFRVTTIFYASLQFCILVEYCTISQLKTRASIPSATLIFLAAIFICITSLLEHTRSSALSFLLSIYLLVSLLLDTVRIRTLWQTRESTALCSTFAAGFAVKLGLLVAESWSKRSLLAKEDREVAGEELAGFLSKSLFLWLNPLLMKGFSNWLTPPDLSPIDSTLSSVRMAKLFASITYTHHGELPPSQERTS